MDTSILMPIILAMSIPSAVTGFCFWLLEQRIKERAENDKKDREKQQKLLDEREQNRKDYELCQLKVTMASMALAEATAEAVQRIPDAHCNGDMHRALEYAKNVKIQQREFLNKSAVDHIDF